MTIPRTVSVASLLQRAIGAMTLDAATFEAVETDPAALFQSVTIVVAASVAAGVGAAIPWEPARLPVLAAAVIAGIGWVAWTALTLLIGTHLMPGRETRATFAEHFRTIGFAAAPACFQFLAAFTLTKWPVFLVTWLWMAAASVVAIRQSLDYTSTWRAIAVCLVALIVLAGIVALF